MKRKQHFQIRDMNYVKRSVDYSVRDLSQLDQLSSKKGKSGCLKFLFFVIIIVAASFFGYSYFNMQKGDLFEIDKGVLKTLKHNKNHYIKENVNTDYYRVSIMIDSGKRRGLAYPEHLTSIKNLQNRLKRKLKLDSISIADYIIRLNNISFRDKVNSSKIPINKKTIMQFFILLETTDINYMDFAGADYSMSYIYLKKNRSRKIDSLKSSINNILKKYSKDNHLKVVIDYKDSPGKITPLKDIKYQYYDFVVEPGN